MIYSFSYNAETGEVAAYSTHPTTIGNLCKISLDVTIEQEANLSTHKLKIIDVELIFQKTPEIIKAEGMAEILQRINEGTATISDLQQLIQ